MQRKNRLAKTLLRDSLVTGEAVMLWTNTAISTGW